MDAAGSIKVMTPEDFSVEYKQVKIKKDDGKRVRSENWSEVDKELLKELVKKRVKEIENKNTDTNTNQMKKKAWLDLEKDFNSLCSSKKRTVFQLKSQWSTIKMQAKKDVSEFRLKAKQTGGGQAAAEVALSGNDISVWLPNEFVVDTNEYDSDAMKVYTITENIDDILEICLEDEKPEITKSQQKEVELFAEPKITPQKKKKVAAEKVALSTRMF